MHARAHKLTYKYTPVFRVHMFQETRSLEGVLLSFEDLAIYILECLLTHHKRMCGADSSTSVIID